MKIQTHRNEVCVKTEAEIGVMLLHVREQQEPQEAGGGHEGFSLRNSEGSMTQDTLISDFRPLNCERITFCCFEQLTLWHFIIAA